MKSALPEHTDELSAIAAAELSAIAAAELSAIAAARQLGIDLNRLYVLLRLGRLNGRKENGEWRVSGRSVEERLQRRQAAAV